MRSGCEGRAHHATDLWLLIKMIKTQDGVITITQKSRFSIPCEFEEVLFQTKFLAVVSSLRHLSMKKFFRLDLPSWL